MSKQDRQGARTVADLERKHGFGKKFAEVMGHSAAAESAAREAQNAAQEAKDAYEGLDHEQIFNLLTEDGKMQGLYRGKDGQVYFNASYLRGIILEAVEIVANTITSGVLKSKDGSTYFDLDNARFCTAKGDTFSLFGGTAVQFDENEVLRLSMATLSNQAKSRKESGIFLYNATGAESFTVATTDDGKTLMRLAESGEAQPVWKEVQINGETVKVLCGI